MALRYLFIDFDSFYASVEQQFSPSLRNKPIAVVPSLNVSTTSCIAASYEAKAYGVKTGTLVSEAKSLCPKIQFIEAKHEKYIAIHKKIHHTIHQILYIDAILSIDEMYGRLPIRWQSPTIATNISYNIKRALKKSIGPYITASIGIAPNRFIAKLASKIDKPNGLKLIDHDSIPDALNKLQLKEITGIGKRMEIRLNQAGIFTIKELFQTSRADLHRIWRSIEGDRFWYGLHGLVIPEKPQNKRSISHSHVLPPSLRNEAGSIATLYRMLDKACHRLRINEYFTSSLSLQIRFGFEWRWAQEIHFSPTQDTLKLAKLMLLIWETRPKEAPSPSKVSVSLMGLIHARNHTPSLFETQKDKKQLKLLRTLDLIKSRYGSRSIYYANSLIAQKNLSAAPLRIAFNHIPDINIERD